jgi:capsular polysaccharide biosynthesis protein
MPAAAAAGAPASLPGRGIKPVVSLIAHPWLALAAFCAVLVLGTPLVFIKGKSYYATTATVQVMPRYMRNLRDHGDLSFPSNTQYREFRQQQARSILRYDIVRDALRSLGDEAALWRRPDESERLAVERLRRTIHINALPDTWMIEVSRQAEQAQGLANLVNAVVETYVARMQDELVFGSDQRVGNLEERRAEVQQAIDERVAERTELALQLGISAFTGTEENPYDRVRAELRLSLAKARRERIAAQAQLEAFQLRGETGIDTRSIQEAVLIDPGLANLKSNLFKRRAELLSEINGLTEEHLAWQELDEELTRIDDEIEGQTAKLAGQIRASLLARYQASLDESRSVEEELAAELAEQDRQGGHFAALYNAALKLSHEIDLARREADDLDRRLNEFAAEENALGFVRLLTPALQPELPFGPGKKKIALLVLIAAFAAGLGAPTARDLLDRRLKTVNDIERILALPSLGWLIEQGDTATCMLAEDQLRRIAGALIREHDTHGTQVFAFSGGKPGAGCSDIVAALGRILDSLGETTLVVEANAFNPSPLFAAPGAPGLAECLSGRCDPVQAVIPAGSDYAARVWVGNTGGRRHLDRLDRLTELNAHWARKHSIILVDLPPMLLSADAEILARNLQHLLLVVESEAHIPGELRRVARLVEKLQPAAVGLLVNRVRPFLGGGYLNELMVEYLTGRKSVDYFTTPSWALLLRAQLLRLRRPSRELRS